MKRYHFTTAIGLPIPHRTLELLLPGFHWVSPGMFVLGLAESFFYGVYVGLLFVPLHNFFARFWRTAQNASSAVDSRGHSS